MSESDWKDLREKLDKHPEVTYFAGDNSGKFEATEGDVVNPVTWGTFPGKEYVCSFSVFIILPNHATES